MENELKLLPCPLCDSDMKNDFVDGSGDRYWLTHICFNGTEITVPGCCDYEVAERWNTRASDNRRCGNCKHWQHYAAEKTELGRCANTGSYQTPDWFCADFTKREG